MALEKYEGAPNIGALETDVTTELAAELRQKAMDAEKARRTEALAAIGDDAYPAGTIIRLTVPPMGEPGNKLAGTYLLSKRVYSTGLAHWDRIFLGDRYGSGDERGLSWDQVRGWLVSWQGFDGFQVIYTPDAEATP